MIRFIEDPQSDDNITAYLGARPCATISRLQRRKVGKQRKLVHVVNVLHRYVHYAETLEQARDIVVALIVAHRLEHAELPVLRNTLADALKALKLKAMSTP